jgi:subtilisin-like proprotein convertase family protein
VQTRVVLVPALPAGIYDLSVDFNQGAGKATLQVNLEGPGTAAGAMPVDQLRPVEPADDRLAFAEDNAPHIVPDGGGSTMPGTAVMTVGGYQGETVTSIELTYEIDAKPGSAVKVDLETPAGPASRLTIRDTGIPDGDRVAQLTVSAAGSPGLVNLLGGVVNGAWKLHVYETATGGGNSNLKTARITLHTTGGPEKVARSASWTSPVLDGQTKVLAIDSATWDERVPDGATLAVYLRTCAQPDCGDTPWPTTPVTKATQFAVTPGRYVQLRVEMTSNGILEPELRMFTVNYRREPAKTLPQRM